MADPIVHITNGVPDLGTGNITTLGQTLVDGANATIGATTDVLLSAGAAGTVNSHLRTISRDIANGIVLQTSPNAIGNVGQSGAPWSENITQFGGVAIATGTGIGGSGIPRVTVSSDSSLGATQLGTWNITNITGSIPLPSGAATAAKQPAPGTSGVPSADVLTVQGVAGMVALKVDGTGSTFPISGTITANQGGTWNITNISGVISLPTGAATSAKQPALGTAGTPSSDVLTVQGSAAMTPLKMSLFGNAGAVLDFAGQNFAGVISSQLVGGQFNTTPTTITSGNFSPLQLDSAGNLLVNVKAGVSGGTSSAFGSAFPSAGTAIGAKDSAGVNMQPLNLDGSGNLKVNVVAGGASGGTSSSFGAAVPGTGTAAGFSDGANMQLGHVWDGDSGVSTQWVQGVLLKTPASGGAVDIGVAGQPLRVDPVGTTAQPVTGTFWQTTQPVSGTVTVQQSTAANLNATVSGNVGIIGTVPVSGTFWQTTQPVSGSVTVTQATAANLNATVSGTVTASQGGTWNITNISGTISLPTGAATAVNQCTAASSASSTAGQTGHLAMGATTTGAPGYTTGQTNPLSLTTSGALRVDGSGATQPVSGTFWQATQPVSIAAAVTVAQATAANLNATVTGTVGATQSGTWTVQPGNTQNTTPWLVLPKGMQDSGGTDMTDTVNHALKVNVVAGGSAGGGTSSSVGGAMPSAATVAMGSVTSAAPSYTTATANALSLTLAGALRTDSSATTQPISGNVGVSGSVAVTGTFWQATQPVSGTVTVTQGTAANLNATVTGTVNAAQSGTWNITNISGTISLPTGAATAANQPTAAAAASTTSGQTGNLALGAVTSAAPAYTNATSNWLSLTTVGALRVDGSAVTQPVSGTVGISGTVPVSGTFWQATQPVSIAAAVSVNPGTIGNWGISASTYNTATPTNGMLVEGQYNSTPGAMTSGNSSPLQLNVNGALRVDGSSVTQPVSIAATVNVQGSVAGGGSYAGVNPVPQGGQAQTSNPTAVSAGQMVNAMFDKVGKQVTVGAIRTLKGVQATTITAATETTIVTAGAAGVFQDLYGLVIANTSATAVNVAIKDATAGTTRLNFQVPAGDTRGFTVPVDSAIVQAAAASNWTATVSSAVTSILITALYVSNT